MRQLHTELVIISGPQVGARMTLRSGRHRVGSSLSSGVVVLDPSMADAHVDLDISPKGVATLRALAPFKLGARSRAIEAGGSAAVRGAVRFEAGATSFLLTLDRPARHVSRVATIALAASCVCLASVFAASRTDSATLQRATPVALATLRPAPPDPLALTSTRLRSAGLDGLALTRAPDGVLTLSGMVSPSQAIAVRELQQWFDGRFGGRALLVDRVALGAAPPTLSIRAAWTGSDPYVIDGSGTRLLPGARLPGGWVLSSIAPDVVLLRQGDRTVSVHY